MAWTKWKVSKGNDGDVYIHWQEDLDYILIYENDLIRMLNKIRKFKIKEKKKKAKLENKRRKENG
tara:strand:- start:168 stop:362 length:195 start_codon:yes stop_codon:yes gene_type:complete